jgi:hypothetical protein
VIRDNVMKPFMRNAMLVRAQNMNIEGNKLDGTHGGVMGLNFTYSMGESAQMRNININKNTLAGFQSSGIIISNNYRDHQGVLNARNIAINDNFFQLGQGNAMHIRGVQNLAVKNNRMEKNGKPVEAAMNDIIISDCVDLQKN